MSDPLILGLDIGTTAVKLAAYAPDGDEVFRVARGYPTRRAGQVAEQDPADWLRLIHEGFAGLEAAGSASRVAAIGVTSQVNTHVFAGPDGAALMPAITWADTRAGDAAVTLDAGISDDERQDWWGAPMGVDASHMAARMAWVADHRPEVWDRTESVLLPKDWVIRQLTGQTVSDPVSNIGAVGRGGRFILPLFERIAGGTARLAPLADPMSVAGEMRLPGADAPVPVAVGLMDAWAGMFGVGVRAEGDAMYLSGTSEIPGVISSAVHPSPGALVFPPNAGITLHAAPTQAGGAALDWICRAFDIAPANLMSEVAALDPDGPRALFLPHLSGERAPIWDPVARGTFLGLDAGMGRAEIARAVLEGVAMSVRLAFEALDVSTGQRAGVVHCGGGGFASDIWNQIRADTLDRRLRRLAARDPGALGAAALASVAAGLHPDLDAALSAAVRFDTDYRPDPAARDRAEALFALYRPAYDAARDTNHALARLNR